MTAAWPRERPPRGRGWPPGGGLGPGRRPSVGEGRTAECPARPFPQGKQRRGRVPSPATSDRPRDRQAGRPDTRTAGRGTRRRLPRRRGAFVLGYRLCRGGARAGRRGTCCHRCSAPTPPFTQADPGPTRQQGWVPGGRQLSGGQARPRTHASAQAAASEPPDGPGPNAVAVSNGWVAR